MNQDAILVEIARCPVARRCLEGGETAHPCSRIVRSQGVERVEAFQVPEPWSGRIGQAPILFIASNPSISQSEIYPTGGWQDEEIADYFTNRFGGGRRPWVRDGTKSLGKDGRHMRFTMFWAAVRKRAEELLLRPAQAGGDYALTEVVHCKSRAELGVPEALDTCVARYLEPVLAASAARILVVLGDRAREAVRMALEIPAGVALHGPVEVAGRMRMVTFLPHPNARKKRTFAHCLTEGERSAARAFLQTSSGR